MTASAKTCAMAMLALLGGCDATPDAPPPPPPAGQVAEPVVDRPAAAPAAAANPDAPPDRSPDAAVRLVTRYYAAIAAKDEAAARAAWGEHGAAGPDRAAFARGPADVKALQAEILSVGRAEPAAGSVYLEVQVRLVGQRIDGTPIRVEGPVVLRYVNDVDGSSAAERRWHIERAPPLAR